MGTFLDELEEIDEQIKELEANPPEEVEEELEEPNEPETVEETVEEPVKTDKSDEDYRKERLERRKQKEAEAAKKVEAPVVEEKKTSGDVMPDPATDYVGYLEWKDRKNEERLNALEGTVNTTIQQTETEKAFERDIQKYDAVGSDFARTQPDYNQAVHFMAAHIQFGLKHAFPQADPASLLKATKEVLVNKMKTFEGYGENPAQLLYDEAYESGYRPTKADVKTDIKTEKKDSPDMSKIAQNRARSGNTVAAKGSGGASNRNSEALTPKEFAKLSPSEKKEYLATN